MSEKRQADHGARLLVIWTMIVGVVLAGLAFAYKIAAFLFTLASPDFRGTFDVSILVYFAVSAGWLCILAWSFMTGKFKQMERSKYDMLEKEEEYERLGI